MTLEPLQLPLTSGPLDRVRKVVTKYDLTLQGPWSWNAWKWMLEGAKQDNFLPLMTANLYVRYAASLASGESCEEFWFDMKEDTKVCGWRHLVFFALEHQK